MTGIAMKRCAQCHGKLGLGARSRNGGTVAGGFLGISVRLIARRFMSWSDTTPASDVTGTHSYLAVVRRIDRTRPSPEIPLWHLLGVFMTLQKAKSIARPLGLTLRKVCSGDYRVNFRDGNKT